MTHIVGLSGSLRSNSYNSGLLRAAEAVLPEATTLEIGSIAEIPLYNGDVEAEGFPAAVTALKDKVAAADGLLLVTPEYNNGIPGVFKNAIDWLSRPSSDIKRIFGGKPVALIGASPGNFGTILSQAAWLPVLRTLGADHWSGGRLLVSHAGQAFDPEGMEQARPLLPETVTYCKDALDAVAGADALVLITEWNEFRALAPARLAEAMRGRVLVDLRNVYDPVAMQQAGFDYHGVGRPQRRR